MTHSLITTGDASAALGLSDAHTHRVIKTLPDSARHVADNGRTLFDFGAVFAGKLARAESRDSALKRLQAELAAAEATLAAEAPPLRVRDGALREALKREREALQAPPAPSRSSIEAALRGEAPAAQPTTADRERLIRDLVREIDSVRAQIAALEARPVEIGARIAKRKVELAQRACDGLVRLAQLATLEYLAIQAEADREIDAACQQLTTVRALAQGTAIGNEAISAYYDLRKPIPSPWFVSRETNAPRLVDRISIVISLNGEPIAAAEPDEEGDE